MVCSFLDNIYLSVKNSIKNYTLTILTSFALFIILSGFTSFYTVWLAYKLILTLFLFLVLSIAVYNFSKNKKIYLKVWLLLLSIIVASIFFKWLKDRNLITNLDLFYIILSYLFAFSFLFLSWYDSNEEKYSYFVYTLILNLIKTLFISTIITIFGNLFFLSMGYLFDLFIPDKLYYNWFLFSFLIFWTFYFLNLFDKKNLDYKHDWVEKYLSLYIFFPFIFIFFTLFIFYAWKLVYDFSSWPSGYIVYIVLFFSIFVYLLYVFANFFIVKSFNRFLLPLLVFIVLPFGFIAIYFRINQYGFTINRYIVLALLSYFALISIYFIFSRKRHLAWLFILFIFVFSLINFWKYSIWNYPLEQQSKKLKNLLQKNHCLNWINQFDIDKCNIVWKDKNELYDKITYIWINHGIKHLTYFKDILHKIIEDKRKSLLEDLEKQYENIKSEKVKKFIKSKMEYIKNNPQALYTNDVLVDNLLYKIKIAHLALQDNISYVYVESLKDNNLDVFWYSKVIIPSFFDNKDFKKNYYHVNIYDGTLYFYEDKKLVWKKMIDWKKLVDLYINNGRNLQNNVEFTYDIWNYNLKLIIWAYSLKKDTNTYKLEEITQAYVLLNRK